MNNYFRSGRYNRKLEQAFSYDKKKKELKDGKNKRYNSEERSREEKKDETAKGQTTSVKF